MNHRKSIYTILCLLALLSVASVAITFYTARRDVVRVTFFDVGQGDAILVSSGSTQILIDGGRNGNVLLEKLGRAIPFWDRQIEAVIVTHPDADHIGGLADAAGAYKVGLVLQTSAKSKSQQYLVWQDVIGKENIRVLEAGGGQVLKLASGAKMEILYPFDSVADGTDLDTNETSVVARLVINEEIFLLTGDLPSKQESELIARNVPIDADILKVGHHGSKYSTNGEFLAAVTPRDAVISVGARNTYGHPANDVLDRLENSGSRILRTDEAGDVAYRCALAKSRCVLLQR